MKFTLLKGEAGFALYKEGKMDASWGPKELESYIYKQIAAKMSPSDVVVDDVFEGKVFPAVLAKPKAPKSMSKTLEA